MNDDALLIYEQTLMRILCPNCYNVRWLRLLRILKSDPANITASPSCGEALLFFIPSNRYLRTLRIQIIDRYGYIPIAIDGDMVQNLNEQIAP